MARIQYKSATMASYERASRVNTAGELTYRICRAGSVSGYRRSRTICKRHDHRHQDRHGDDAGSDPHPRFSLVPLPYLKSLREKISTDAVSRSAM